MGGRGASSGMSDKGHEYGTDYKTVLIDGNIKFITQNRPDAETLMETMTRGRVYVLVNKDNNLRNITYFNNELGRNKVIDLRHSHKGMKPHTHHGYIHNENDSSKGASNLTTEERAMVDKVTQLWYKYNNKKK